MDLTITQGLYSTETCPQCGRRLLVNGKCEREHKPKIQRIKKYSGKSNSVNKYNEYQ